MLVFVEINSVVAAVLDILAYDVLNVEYTVVKVLKSEVTLVMLPMVDACEVTDVCGVVDVLLFGVEYMLVTKVVEAVLDSVMDAVLLAVLLHVTLCNIQNTIIVYTVCLYVKLSHLRQVLRIFYSKFPSTVNNKGSVSRSVRRCSASCSPIRCDRRKQMTSAPTKIISPETQAQWSERPDHWRFKSEIIALSVSWESVTTPTLPGPG